MKLKTLQSKYVQKSRVFLYPLLNIKRGVSVTPVETYLSWDGYYSIDDCKFICVYHVRNDTEYKRFTEHVLKTNPLYEEAFLLEDEKIAYVFDYSSFREDYNRVVKGRYSKLSPFAKQKIAEFFKGHIKHHAYISSYLAPDKYYDQYAHLLKVDTWLLKSVGELCSIPDLTSENLVTNKKFTNFEVVNNSNQQEL